MTASERSILIDHIMDKKMPNNLGMALDTADVMYDVQKQILLKGASAIVERVVADSMGKLRCVENTLAGDPMTRYTGLSFRNDDWPAEHMVAMEAQNGHAARFIIGILTGRRPLDERLGGLLKEYPANSSINEHWPWYYSVAAPYDRWTSKAAILGFRSGDAVTEVASQLTAVIATLDRFSSSIATA